MDNIPPAPPSLLRAADVPDDGGGFIEVTWVLSPDDRAVFVGPGAAQFLSDAGSQSVRRERAIDGYRIYRRAAVGEFELAGQVDAGADHFVDGPVANGIAFVYDVRAVDGNHEVGPEIAAGSPGDQARQSRARDNGKAPRDAAGSPILGWFDPVDDAVDFNDFFLFADHFGTLDGEVTFDPLFDLDGDLLVDFDDFFIFADNFGRRVANLAEVTAP